MLKLRKQILDAKAEKAKLAGAALYNIKYRKNEEERLGGIKKSKERTGTFGEIKKNEL